MALIQCTECGREISDRAASCPGCGAAVSPDHQDKSITKKKRHILLELLLLFSLVVIGIVVVAVKFGQAPSGPDMYAIKPAAESVVKEGLKDPESARFQGEYLARDRSGDLELCGEVDAKNSFGGYVGFRRFVVSIVGGEAIAPALMDPVGDLDGSIFDKPWRDNCTNRVQSNN